MRKRFYRRKFTPSALLRELTDVDSVLCMISGKLPGITQQRIFRFAESRFHVAVTPTRFLVITDLTLRSQVFPTICEIKKSRDQCVGVSFAVLGSRMYG